MPDITITLSPAQANRLRDAFATAENPAPNLADLKQELSQFLRARVRQHERGVAERAIPDATFDPT